MIHRTAADWEVLARTEPYFAVLANGCDTDVAASSVATAGYFDTGESDVVALLQAVGSVLGRDIPLGSALDFGCGAGRLTIPLARRAQRVVACDIAPTMLLHARRNVEAAGLHGVTYLLVDDALQLPRGSFDFVVSLLVLQYVSPGTGYALIRTLTRLLAPGGVAALHAIGYEERLVQRSAAQGQASLLARFPLGQGDVFAIGRTFDA